MARFLVLWRRSPTAWPTDPIEYSNLVMKIGPLVDDIIKTGKVIEHGHFLDGTSGYSIWDAEAADLLKFWSMVVPYYEKEIHEFISYKESREILGAVFRAQAEATK